MTPRLTRFAAPAAAVLALGAATAVFSSGASAGAAAPGTSTFAVHKLGTSTITPYSGSKETRPDGEAGPAGGPVMNRSPHSRAKASRGATPPSGVIPTKVLSVTNATNGFRGINHYEQRMTDGGNQYSLVPPDQALCAGNGQVFEGVNDAVRTYSPGGAPLSDVVSINQFFFQDHQIDRATGVASPHSLGDPSCVYDAGSDRFFLTVYDLVEDSAGNLQGPSFVDIAVSAAHTTLGKWAIYQIDTTDDGRGGTPSHPNCPCFGDYPHLGTDANGLYITTNEFVTLADGFNGAQVYAISKAALTSGDGGTITGAHIDTARTDQAPNGLLDGYSLAPALSAGTDYAPDTMYFLSSDADAGDSSIVSHQILQWKIANTSALAKKPGSLRLTHTTVRVNGYYIPPMSEQKAGPTPLADCLNVTACAKALLGTPNRYKESEFAVDSNDTRMLQSAYADGQLWGALDTAVDIGGTTKAGIAYYVINPSTSTAVKQDTLAVTGDNITYPALGVTSAGLGVMTMSLIGKDYYPSAAYVTLNGVPDIAPSPVTVVGAGEGPYDSFDGYRAYEYNHPRWGDYGAASVVDGTVYVASEYIAQSCTLSQYEAAPFGTCGGTRTALSNWATHVAAITP